ncbi:MAG: amino acid permease [Pirellulales bacterium]
MVTPRRTLTTLDAIAMVVGIVIGAGIFRLPPLVASNVDSAGAFIAVWAAGGLISLVGALCYAELASTYPNTGGDYHFLTRAYGPGLAFLFAWARLAVIQTGSIALLAFAIGDYVEAAFTEASSPTAKQWVSSLCAAAVVIGLTGLNIAGVRVGKTTQNFVTVLTVLGTLLVVIAGAVVAQRGGIAASPTPALGTNTLGMAMVFVLFTYGGWNEAAYLSAEMKGGRRSIVVALMLGIATVTLLYLLVNVAYMAAMGIEGVRASKAVAAETLDAAWGTTGAMFITAILIVAALSTANATVFTGARSNYALGRDFPIFRFLGQWTERSSTPRNAFLVQGLIALALVGLGAFARDGVKTMVDYTSPVFWFFFLLVGVSLFVLRYKDPHADRPFRVPFYPVLPAIFCVTSAYLLYSSLAYYQRGALVGVGVLAAGVPFMVIAFLKRN